MFKTLSSIRGIGTAAAVLLTAFAAHAQATVFDFAGNLTGIGGPATASFYNGTTTSNVVSFGTASSFGLPALPGGDATVMSFPGFANNQGISLLPNTGPNGGSASYINQYTMGWDVLITQADSWFSFYNSNENNANDGEFFKRPNSSGNGVGISGDYDGTINTNTWYRVMITVDTSNGATPTMRKYINGVFVGDVPLDGFDGRWSLYSTVDNLQTLLLTDNDGDTSPGFIGSYYFNPLLLSDNAVAAFGAPTAQGFLTRVADTAPEPASLALLLPGLTLLRGRCRKK